MRKVIEFNSVKKQGFIVNHLATFFKTVKKYIQLFSDFKLIFEELEKLTDFELIELFSI